MNGIDDLRQTLDQHTTDLVDTGLPQRGAAVHGRVRAIRRRRRAVAAGGIAAAVAVVGGVALLPSADDTSTAPAPADTVVGVDVPQRIDALGFGYRLTDTADFGSSTSRVELEPSDRARLVTWATSGETQTVQVDFDLTGQDMRHLAPDFGDWVYVPPGTDAEVKAHATEGDVGLAVYTIDPSTAPAGHTEGVTTFREQVAESRLIAADVGEPGEAQLSVPVAATSGQTDVWVFCTGAGAGTEIELYVGDDPGPAVWGTDCSGPAPVDVATEGYSTGLTTRPGQDADLRVVLRGPDGEVLDDPDVVVGVGAYASSPVEGGSDLPRVFERFGHRWELLGQQTGPVPADREWLVEAPSHSRFPMLTVVAHDVDGATIDVVIDGDSDFRSKEISGVASDLTRPGTQAGYRVVDGVPEADDRASVGFYERVD